VQLASSTRSTPGAARLPGLDPEGAYRVEPLAVAGLPDTGHVVPPPWYAAGGVTVTGRVLAAAGLQMPVLLPEQALVLHLARTTP
jgi:alpha-galactosidase